MGRRGGSPGKAGRTATAASPCCAGRNLFARTGESEAEQLIIQLERLLLIFLILPVFSWNVAHWVGLVAHWTSPVAHWGVGSGGQFFGGRGAALTS
eukprot:6328795-Pyramimonas_sp.AAC.1